MRGEKWKQWWTRALLQQEEMPRMMPAALGMRSRIRIWISLNQVSCVSDDRAVTDDFLTDRYKTVNNTLAMHQGPYREKTEK